MTTSSEIDLMMATGGKNNDLKLWDGNRPDSLPIFKAKNVKIRFITFLKILTPIPGSS